MDYDHIAPALIFLAGICALMWADLGRKTVDAENEQGALPEVEKRRDQRLREAGE